MHHRLSISLLLSLLLSACASGLIVEQLQPVSPDASTFIFLSATRWDAEFRFALQKQGLKVLRSEPNTGLPAGNVSTSSALGAHYGIEIVKWSRVPMTNNCITNTQHMMINLTVQVVDLRTHEVLISIANGGATIPFCGMLFNSSTVFDDVATSIAAVWFKRESSQWTDRPNKAL